VDPETKSILVVDDEVAVTNFIMVFLMQTGRYEVTVINDSRRVQPLLAERSFDVILLDMDMPEISGMDILRNVAQRRLPIPVVVLTGVADVDLAVKAMKLGAFDYLIKPVEDEILLSSLDAAVEHGTVQDSIRRLPAHLRREDLSQVDAFEHLVAGDAAMIHLLHAAEKVASTHLAVFIHGEPHTGKQTLARAIHTASPRQDGPFTVFDVRAHEPERVAAAFFGRAASSNGRGEEIEGALGQAAGGSIYIVNIDAAPVSMQERLRKAMKSGLYYRDHSTATRSCTTRFIATSTLDLRSEAQQQGFSTDLALHLAVNTLSVPPLRERRADISLLAERFLRIESDRDDRGILGFAPACLEVLVRYNYPGNVQELRSIVRRALLEEQGTLIELRSLPAHVRGQGE
jgi:two-component system, NtrC family, response regulator HydG